jgi:hypothetical protein
MEHPTPRAFFDRQLFLENIFNCHRNHEEILREHSDTTVGYLIVPTHFREKVGTTSKNQTSCNLLPTFP